MSDRNPARLMVPLSEEEIDELDDFLMSDAVSDETMMLDQLDGYLTAIIIGPTTLRMQDWLSGIWGPGEEHAPEFETMDQAQRILDLITRYMNGIVRTGNSTRNAGASFTLIAPVNRRFCTCPDLPGDALIELEFRCRLGRRIPLRIVARWFRRLPQRRPTRIARRRAVPGFFA